jgi:hypothetical protein
MAKEFGILGSSVQSPRLSGRCRSSVRQLRSHGNSAGLPATGGLLSTPPIAIDAAEARGNLSVSTESAGVEIGKSSK